MLYSDKKLPLVTMQRKIQSLYNIEKSIAIKNKKWIFFQPDMECFHFTEVKEKKWKKFNLLSFFKA
jgi:hypothetical protein